MIDPRLITPEIAALVQSLTRLAQPSTASTVDEKLAHEERITRLIIEFEESREIEIARLKAQIVRLTPTGHRFPEPRFMTAKAGVH